MRLTIKTKLAAIFAVILMLLGAMAYLAISSLSTLHEQLEQVVNVSSAQVHLSAQLQANLVQIDSLINDHINEGDEAELAAIETKVVEAEAAVAQLLSELNALSNPGTADLLSQITALLPPMKSALEKVTAASHLKTKTKAGHLSADQSLQATTKITNLIEAVRRAAQVKPTLNLPTFERAMTQFQGAS